MGWLVVLILLAALVVVGIGVFIEGLLWLLVIAAVLAVAGALVGRLGRSGTRVR